MKWAGAALLIAASWIVGQCAAADLKRRAELLSLFGESVRLIGTEIRYSLALLEDVLRRLREDPRFTPLSFYGRLRSDAPWPPQLTDTLFLKGTPLRRSDRALILQFLAGLGASDAEGQTQHCALYEEKALAAAQDASRRAEREGLLWRRLAPLGGVLLALLLI